MEREEKVLKALANKKRLLILNILKKSKDEVSITDIARKIKLSLKCTSKHVARLEQAGLIKKNRCRNLMLAHIPKKIWRVLNLLGQIFYRKKK